MRLFTKQHSTTDNGITVIAGSCAIEGKLELSSELQLAGIFKGDILSSSTVVIAAGASVTGDIRAEQLIIKGEIKGECIASSIHILQPATVDGTLYTDQLSIEAGARFMGQSCAFPSEKRLAITNNTSDTSDD